MLVVVLPVRFFDGPPGHKASLRRSLSWFVILHRGRYPIVAPPLETYQRVLCIYSQIRSAYTMICIQARLVRKPSVG